MDKQVKKIKELTAPKVTKKEQIITLFQKGNREIESIAKSIEASPSYVADVLHRAGLLREYNDLYTSTKFSINVYAELFANRMRFKTIALAKGSITYLDSCYKRFEKAGDKAGQHHTLTVALTMFHRASGIGKLQEAELFRKWLIQRLESLKVINNS